MHFEVKMKQIKTERGAYLSEAEIFVLTARRFNELPSVSGLASFLPVPVSGCEGKGHGEIAKRYQVQIDGSEFRVTTK